MTMSAPDHHPESEFASPQALATSSTLPVKERLRRLEIWRQTVEDRLAASNEGMPSHGDNAADLRLLAQIAEATHRLAPANAA